METKEKTHPNAAGIGISDRTAEKLIDYSNKELAEYDFGKNFYIVDYLFDNHNINELQSIIFDISQYGDIWGSKVEQPLLATNKLLFTSDNVEIVGGGTTVKINIGGVTFIKFKDQELASNICFMNFGKITLVGTPQINEWGGIKKPQILIKDYELFDGSADF